MEHEFSDNLKRFQTGIFAALNEKKEALQKEGKEVFNFSVGTPDFEPPKHVMRALSEAAMKPENYRYALRDLPELIEAVQKFYQKRFGVTLKETEVMSLYGSQEGMAHLSLALCNPQDIVLVPNPGYPIFSIGPIIAQCQLSTYPLYRENNFLPDLKKIPCEVALKAKYMVVSYPSNPVCTVANDTFYEELIEFATKYNIMILHDNAYSDIVCGDGYGKSFLSYEGAKEVGIEFYSLSKSYNMTGARISFAVGNEEMIEKFKQLRSQIDFGIFLPIQYAAIAALTGPRDNVIEQKKQYEIRNHALCSGLRSIGWEVQESQGTMFVWAPLPKGYTNSEDFTMKLAEKSGVLVVPGSSFGSLGEGFVRFALVHNEETIQRAIDSIAKSGVLNI